jgi:hypothetical protein
MAATCSNVRPSGRGLSTTAATAARHLDLGEANQEALATGDLPDQSKIWTSTTVTSSGLGVTPDYGFLTLPVGLTAGSASG